MANSEDPDENATQMWHFIRVCTVCKYKNDLQREKNQYYLEIITCDPSVYAMDHLDLTVSNFFEDSIDKSGIQVASFLLLHMAGFPRALEIMENWGNHKKVPCMEKSWNLKEKKLKKSWKNHGIL